MAKSRSLGTAIALLEYASIAAGIEAGDAMVKRSPVEVIHAGTVHPGKYLVLVGGEVADVEEAMDAADRLGPDLIADKLLLPDPHPGLVAGLAGVRATNEGESLGVIETSTVAAVIRAADAGLKAANVVLREVFMADGLGGKGYLLFSGSLVDVEAAVDAGTEQAPHADLVGWRVIAQLHGEMAENLNADGRFATQVRPS